MTSMAKPVTGAIFRSWRAGHQVLDRRPRPWKDLRSVSGNAIRPSPNLFPHVFLSVACLVACASCAAVAAPLKAAETPQYVFFSIAPYSGWSQDDPQSLTPALFLDVRETLQTPDAPSLRVGLLFHINTLLSPLETLQATVARLCALAEDTSVPLLLVFDGQNWWESRPDLWNWWDPAKPGYDPKNAWNVEWTDWGPQHAVKIGWRNWGSQVRVAPAPNIASPRVVSEHVQALKPLAAQVAAWHRALPREKKWLCGGIKVGWEAGIGYNAQYFPNGNEFAEKWPDDPSHDPRLGVDFGVGLCGGLGHAAAMSAGIRRSGALTRDDIGLATQRYLQTLARVAYRAGMPRDKIFTHQGGNCPPYEEHLPFWPAFNRYSLPGWSFYWGDPAAVEELRETLARRRTRTWAAAEWWWGASTAQEWKEHFEKTLGYLDCRFVGVYNWNQGGFKTDPNALEGFRALLREWEGRPGAPGMTRKEQRRSGKAAHDS
ncbi:MAG TPA: hypothetical protein PLO62_04235 [Candidatus Hydrogenedentes bacterium]|nr:hypothetical protein [Candidatus Hydrogenedentota bacterium]HOS03975.1 hypothetical protein [Candidatus Hydrogenedentota bacterium]